MFLRITIAFLLIIGIATAATYYVPDDYPTIQDAINACVDGDVVIVRPGIYVENIDFVGKAITIKSEMGPEATVVDGNQAGSVAAFQNGEGTDSILEGFTITNGLSLHGGGIYCYRSSPEIVRNNISNNTAEAGGGMFFWESNSITHHNVVTENAAIGSGGNGGGIYCYDSSLALSCNALLNNTATWTGGGICCSTCPVQVLTNHTISGNSSLNFGGGIECWYSSMGVDDSIIWSNTAVTGPAVCVADTSNPSVFSISFSDVEGGQSSISVDPGCTLIWGSGMIDADPLLVDPVVGDFHITYNSPCRDTGDNSAVTEPIDYEGDPRIALGTVDMGADEFWFHLYHTGEVVPGGNIDVKVVGGPAMSVMLEGSSYILDPPVSTQYGILYMPPPYSPFSYGNIPSNGVLIYSATIPTTWMPGEHYFAQALVGNIGNPQTRLTNLMTLTVE